MTPEELIKDFKGARVVLIAPGRDPWDESNPVVMITNAEIVDGYLRLYGGPAAMIVPVVSIEEYMPSESARTSYMIESNDGYRYWMHFNVPGDFLLYAQEIRNSA